MGRNTLIGVASLMLLIISGFATWHGMRDFIIGVSSTPTGQGQLLPGGMSVSNDVLVIVVVSALTFLMWLMLRETFGAQRHLRERLITFPLYVFLAIWSIGFGYGFWWSLISGEEATRTGLAGLQEDARDASAVIAARLDAVRAQLDSVVSWSDEPDGARGNQRGELRGHVRRRQGPALQRPPRRARFRHHAARRDEALLARPGRGRRGGAAQDRGGPYRRHRRGAPESLRSQGVGDPRPGTQHRRALQPARQVDGRRDAAIAGTVAIRPEASGFSCYDPTLAERLRQAAAQAEQPAELKLREAVFNEGPAGVANAVKNLWRNIGAYSTSLVSYIFSGGTSTVGRTDSGEPITGRDLIALLATIGIDLGLLALAIVNPPRGESRRLSAREAGHINEAIDTAITRAGVDREWVRHHFIHHNRASYFVIPNLYSAASDDTMEDSRSRRRPDARWP